MKIEYRFVLNVDHARQAALQELGVQVEQGRSQVVLIQEGREHWREIAALAETWIPVSVQTTYSEAEREASEFLNMLGNWHHGYPQPEAGSGYLEQTFDLTGFSRATGIGKTQKAPFRLTREPRWGTRSFLQLNWVADVFFTKPEVWRETFEPHGIGCMDVVHHRTNKPLTSVVQLLSQGMAAGPLELTDAPYELCDTTGVRKYHPITRGFTSFRDDESLDYFCTQEFFGYGGRAFREVIVSQRLYQRIKGQRLRGLAFRPMMAPPPMPE